MLKLIVLVAFFAISSSSFAEVNLINGRPVGDLFKGVGMFNSGCTITKVGFRQFITAAHCVDGVGKSLSLSFKDFRGKVKILSKHVHPTWIKDCAEYRCTGHEVGTARMTPGRSDVAFFNVVEETPLIPVIKVKFEAFPQGTEVAMVGGGCTRNVEPGGSGSMRYAITKTSSSEALNHQHSLYQYIAEITGQSNWITPGYGVHSSHASLCPGDSGGPLLTKDQNGDWEIVGIAADYTFDGPYRDGNVTVTNLHTRLDDESANKIGDWIRTIWAKEP